MAYAVPQVQVFQEFAATPIAVVAPLNACIVGPQADLHRYTESDERASGALGVYDETQDVAYDWPGRPAGAKVDLGFTRLFVEDGKLLYYSDPASSGGLVAPVSGFRNHIRAAGAIFKTTTVGDTTYDRSATLYDRDVKVGDLVYVRGVAASVEYELLSAVRGFVGDPTDAVTAAAESASTNAADGSAYTNVDKLAGADNCITLTPDGSAYSGLASGDVTEAYTIEVTRSSVSGDLTTARIKVTSASGRDNASNVTPEAADSPTDIGSRGLTVAFGAGTGASCSSAAGLGDYSPDDLIAGQTWRVRVGQDFSATTATSGGDYTGLVDTTYIVEVTKGGEYGDDPEVTVSTTTGVDSSGPTAVSAAATDVAVGTDGILIQFDGTYLRKGDKFYIEATSSVAGAVRTLILADDLPEEILDVTDLDLKLYVPFTGEISANRLPSAPLTNWDTAATEITVNGGIELFDSSWTDDGTELGLPLVGGNLFVHYRSWVITWVGQLGSTVDVSELPSLVGTVDPDNPLAFGIDQALANSNGVAVKFTGVTDPDDLDAWLAALEVVKGRTDLYNLVPLTFTRSALDAFASFAGSESAPAAGRWKACFFAQENDPLKALVTLDTSSNGAVALAKLADDPDATGTQYTLLTVPANNAKFISRGVRAGDTVRFLFSPDGFGNESYTTFTVDEVLSETSLRLADGHTVAITVAQKVEVWRTLTGTEYATQLASLIGSFGNRRVCVLANGTMDLGGFTGVAGYFGAALVAGLRSGVLAHQNLTNVEISGIEGVGSPIASFNSAALDTLAESGAWIITRLQTGQFVTRDALTTDVSDLNHRSEMVRSNLDSISVQCRAVLVPFIGRANVADDVLRQIRTELGAALSGIQASTNVALLGPQLQAFEIVSVAASTLFRDKVIITVNLTLPYPLNYIALHLLVI